MGRLHRRMRIVCQGMPFKTLRVTQMIVHSCTVLSTQRYCLQTCTGDRRTTGQWKKGPQVKGSNLPKGTAIATFPGGSYRGHAAVYIGQDKTGIQVWDQWVGHPVSQRTIRWNGGSLSNDGNQFYVIQ